MRTGDRLGHYEIVTALGAGAMGEVYRARDSRLRRDVAIKLVPQKSASDRGLLDRLEREAHLLASLNHPNIATIHSLEEHADTRFLVLEVVEGESLDHRLRAGPLEARRALELGLQIADALGAAHAKGIIHRDLKPSNVMVTAGQTVKLLDFGIAKPMSLCDEAGTLELTAAGTLVGTAAYMSPEQVRGRSVDQRSDLWAFGCVLYEMLTGEQAFYRETVADTLSAILEYEPDWGRLPPPVPDAVRALLVGTLQKDVQQRVSEAAEARQAIEHGISEPTSERSSPAPAAEPEPDTGRVRSIAVLPLANLSADPDQEFFSDGMTEALITDLAKIGAIRVISRSSVMRYKGSTEPLPAIARRLGVDAILDGSVLRAGDQVRVSARLVHAATDTHLWADSYDHRLEDILTVLSKVARAIVGEVKGKLTPQQEGRLATGPQVNPRAHDEYLRARYHLHKITPVETESAIRRFRRAIDIDPTQAAAYAGLADAYLLKGSWLKTMPAAEALPLGKAAAKKALELDPSLVEAHVSLGFAAMFYDWDWEMAEREYRIAIEANPSHSAAHMYYCWCLGAQLRVGEAIKQLTLARRLDPLSGWVNASHAVHFYWSGRYDDAIRISRGALELAPEMPLGNWVLGVSLAANGMYDEAVDALRATLPDGNAYLGWLGYALALRGDVDEAGAVIAQLEQLRSQGATTADDIARIHIALGKHDEAFEWLDRGLDERSHFVVYLKVDPSYAPIRSDERYARLLERVGLSV